MAAVVGMVASDVEAPRREEDFTGAVSDDEGEQSDSTRSDSTRVPSVPCLENPKTRWADILSDDDEPCECPSPSLPSSSQTSAGKFSSKGREAKVQSRADTGEKKAKRQCPKVWAEKRAPGGGTSSSSSAWSQSASDDHWWSQASYGSWDASWNEWWEPADTYVDTYANAWARGDRSAGGASKWGRSRGGSGSMAKKSQCQFLIGIEEEPKFHVVRRVLGPRGQHMKEIVEKTGAKLRLRGRGSNFLEGPEQLESPDPLMLCVSAPDSLAYDEAKRLTQELLEGVHAEYRAFCTKAGIPVSDLCISLHEGPREGAY